MSSAALRKKTSELDFTESTATKTKHSPGDIPLYYKNAGLFSDNYLENHLCNSGPKQKDKFIVDNWETEILPEFTQTYEWMISKWNEIKDEMESMKEAQIEEEWVRPLLQKLGWEYEVQPELTKLGKRQIPDYALFNSAADKKKARGSKTDEAYFKHCLAVADAKAMSIDLDGSAQNNSNPSYQIVQYLSFSNTDWGILTNGRYWRIYSLRSKSRYRTYFEVNVEKFLTGDTRHDDRFKIFFNFFRKEAFVRDSSNGQNFLDVVFDEGERYAHEVETNLKERVFNLADQICNGFVGDNANLNEDELKEIYDHSLYFLFRLMFILNCEAKGILNVSRTGDYFPHSLRSLCVDLRDEKVENTKWSAQGRCYSHVMRLFKMLAKGDSTIGISGFGTEVFSSGKSNFFSEREISDQLLASVLLELSCFYDKREGNWQFIDYKRLSPDHLGSLFEGLLEFKLEKQKAAKGSLKYRLESTNEDKKKFGAVYTPDAVVDFVVSETLRPLVENKSAEEILNLKIIDPTVGSGHFLLGVIDYLEDSIVRRMISEGDEVQVEDANIRWKVLHSCIYGIDINPLAVELTKFSLWMATAKRGIQLEPLSDQIQTGDSLDSLCAVEKNFPEVGKVGGFDAIVGNPPYVRSAKISADRRDILRERFKVATGAYDLFILFFEAAKPILKKDTGRLGFVVSNKLAVADYAKICRKMITTEYLVESLIDFTRAAKVFKSAAVVPMALVLTNCSPPKKDYKINVGLPDDTDLKGSFVKRNLSEVIGKNDAFELFRSPRANQLLEKIGAGAKPIGSIETVRTGIMGFEYWAHEPFVQACSSNDPKNCWKLITPGLISRLESQWKVKPLRLYKKKVSKPGLMKTDKLLSKGTKALFDAKKVIIRGVGKGIAAFYDEESSAMLVAVHAIESPKYPYFCTALFNSTLVDWIYCVKLLAGKIPQGSLKYPVAFIEDIPVKEIGIVECEKKLSRILKSAKSFSSIRDEMDRVLASHYGLSASDLKEMREEVDRVLSKASDEEDEDATAA